MRFLLRLICDKHCARILFVVFLCVDSIPSACTGFVNSAKGLAALQLFVGVAGGKLVMC